MSDLKQAEKICLNCPLLFCDAENLFCAFRWATSPNDAQKKATKSAQRERRLSRRREYYRARRKKGLVKNTADRTDYYAAYYLANREKKLAAAKDRAVSKNVRFEAA